MKKFDTMEALQAAVAAYEVNDCAYIKDAVTKYNHDLQDYEIVKWSNKDILRAHFKYDYFSIAAQKPPTLIITDQHKQDASDIKNYIKGCIFKILAKPEGVSDNLSFPVSTTPSLTYEEQLYNILMADETDVTHFGFIASAPGHYFKAMHRKALVGKVKQCKDKYFGEIGSGALLEDFEVLFKHKSRNFDGHVFKGICDNLLFLFFTTCPVDNIHVGSRLKLSGNISAHVLEDDTSMTKLNRVIIHKVVQ